MLIEVGIPNSVSCILCDNVPPYEITHMYRPPDKRAYLKIFFFFLFLNQNMWVLKRTTPNHKVMDKKIIAVYSQKFCSYRPTMKSMLYVCYI